MITVSIVAIVGLTLVCLAQSYLILQLNILYKSKDLKEYVTLTTPEKEEPEPILPEEVEIERYP